MQKNNVPQIVDGHHVLKLGKDEIIARFLTGAARASRLRGKPMWTVVADQTALGSGFASQLCSIYGFDPDK